MVRFYAYILSGHLRGKRTIITRFEQSYGRVPFAGLCRSFISVYVPDAGLPAARASASPALHELGNCQGTDGCAVGQQLHGTPAVGKLDEGDIPAVQHAKGYQLAHTSALIALFDQQYRHVAADISGTASHQNGFHTRVLLLSYTLNKP